MSEKDLQDLYKTIAGLKTKDEVRQFFTDLCTPAELMAMADRWKAARLLREGLSYREIYEKSGVSTATVTRVARCLTLGAGGYRLVLDRNGKEI
jgi:TrpR-related protein YerC/YecD